MSAGLWRDEGSTYFDIAGSFSRAWSNVQHYEWSPPLYFMLEHAWTSAAGTTEIIMRMPSLMFGTATILVVYACGLRLGARLTALVAAMMAAAAPLAVSVGTEARAYGLTMFLSAFVLYAFLSVDCAAMPRRRWLFATALALCATLLVCTHFTGYVVVATVTIAALVRMLRRPDAAGQQLASAMVLASLLALLFAGSFLHAAGQQMAWHVRSQGPLVAVIDDNLGVFAPFGAMSVQFDRVVEIGAAIWLVRLARLRFASPSAAATLLLLFVVVAGVGVGVARSLPNGRHLAVYAPFAWLFVASMLTAFVSWLRGPNHSMFGRIVRPVAALAVLYVLVGGVAAYRRTYATIRKPGSGAEQLITTLRARIRQPVLLIACPDYLGPGLAYYARGSREAVHGVVTWNAPWFYSDDPADWRAPHVIDRLIARIDRDAHQQHAAIALAVDWNVPNTNGINFNGALDLAKREMRMHRVLWRREFPGTREAIELIVLASASRTSRQR